jgi:hypothetical protein
LPAVEEIAQSNTGLRHLRIMTALTELEPLDSNRQVGVSPLYKDSERFGLDRQGLSSDLDALQDRGWIWFERSAAGIGTVIVAQPGVDAAEEFKELKNNPRRRVQEIRDAILNWLYDLYLGDDHARVLATFSLATGHTSSGTPTRKVSLLAPSGGLGTKSTSRASEHLAANLSGPNSPLKPFAPSRRGSPSMNY